MKNPPDSFLIEAFRDEFRALRSLAERAAAQLDDDHWLAQLDAEANSVALLMKQADHDGFVDAYDTGVFQGGRGRLTNSMSDEAGFSKKGATFKNRDNGFLAMLRDHGQFDLASLDIEHGVRRIPLRVDKLLPA